ncbi:MAG: HEAT repeat domain-containing protein [Anaerolineae bacterium]|nr:HEAT repeat domain-containing protein [Anaerolineae bacterium]
MGHVYISYKPKDAAFAADLIRQLEDAGFRVWSDTERLRADGQWRESIDQAIRDAFALLVIQPSDASASEHMMYEWTFALGVGVSVIPIVLKPADIHPRLEALPRLDFSDPDAQPWGKLIRQVQNACRSGPSVPARPSRNAVPFGSPLQQPSGSLLERIKRREDANNNRRPDQGIQTETVEKLIERLERGDNREACIAAIQRLGELGDKAAIPALIKLLRGNDWRARDVAARALGQIKAVAAVPVLLDTLRVRAPGPFGGGGNVMVITAALRDIGEPAIPVLIDALDDADWQIRLHATDVLGDIGGEDVVPALIDSLHDPEARVRWRAAEALANTGNISAVPDLVRALRDSEHEVRISAASALGRIGDAAAVPGLIDKLRDRDWRARWAAAEALWRIGEAAVAPLLAALRENDERVRPVAIHALVEIGEPAIPGLVVMLDDADWDVRYAAAEALQGMGKLAVPALMEALHNTGWQASWAAAEALRRIDTPEAQAAVKLWRGEPEPDADEAEVSTEVEIDTAEQN